MSALEDARKAVAEQELAAAVDRRERQALNANVKRLETEVLKLRGQLGMIEALEGSKSTPPKWIVPKNPPKGNRATLCTLLTDTHFDENVDPAQIDDLNCYSREIAEIRLERYFTKVVSLGKHYLSGVTYDGAALFLGGDIFSGNIHEELQRTNADTLFGSLLYWLGPMRAGIEMLASEFGKLHVAGVPGNHGRLSRKPIAKQRAADNLDWLLYRLLARELKNDDRITWEIPTSADAHVRIYNTQYLLTHGDQFRGGSGIAGALSPLLLGMHRKTKRQAAVGKTHDCLVMGHWHSEMLLRSKGLLAGGSLKGYDEYAFVSNFDYEPAQQALWITTPEHGIGFTGSVNVQKREEEGW